MQTLLPKVLYSVFLISNTMLGKYCLGPSTLLPGDCQAFDRVKTSVRRFLSPGADAQGKEGSLSQQAH